jgi:hypothetical protein
MLPHLNELKINRIRTRYETLSFLSVLTGTKYLFDEEKVLYKALPNALYVIDKLSFGASIPENFFSASIEEAVKVSIKRDTTKTIINNSNFEISQYWGNYELNLPFKGADNYGSEGEDISVQIGGLFNQTQDLVSSGTNQIKLDLTFKIYEIQDSEFIAKYWDS